jgi:hypothetical protein
MQDVLALAYLPLKNAELSWLLVMENAPVNIGLSIFLDYFVEQWLENPHIPAEMCNVRGQRHRTNNGFGGRNPKLNTIISRKPPNVHLGTG